MQRCPKSFFFVCFSTSQRQPHTALSAVPALPVCVFVSGWLLTSTSHVISLTSSCVSARLPAWFFFCFLFFCFLFFVQVSLHGCVLLCFLFGWWKQRGRFHPRGKDHCRCLLPHFPSTSFSRSRPCVCVCVSCNKALSQEQEQEAQPAAQGTKCVRERERECVCVCE